MRTAAMVFLLKTHAVTNKHMSEPITRQKFVEDMLNAHKNVLYEAWTAWELLVDEEIKTMVAGHTTELEKKYPNGFYDFAIEHINKMIADNGGEKVEKPAKKAKK